MSSILIVAGDPALLRLLAGALGRLGPPLVGCARRADAGVLLGPQRQVLVHAPESTAVDPSWVAAMLEAHPALRAVYLSPTPWVSLPYARARCMLQPPALALLSLGLLRRLVAEMLAA